MGNEKRLSASQLMQIRKHNAEMKIIFDTSAATGLSGAALWYCASVGMIGMPWIIRKKVKATNP